MLESSRSFSWDSYALYHSSAAPTGIWKPTRLSLTACSPGSIALNMASSLLPSWLYRFCSISKKCLASLTMTTSFRPFSSFCLPFALHRHGWLVSAYTDSFYLLFGSGPHGSTQTLVSSLPYIHTLYQLINTHSLPLYLTLLRLSPKQNDTIVCMGRPPSSLDIYLDTVVGKGQLNELIPSLAAWIQANSIERLPSLASVVFTGKRIHWLKDPYTRYEDTSQGVSPIVPPVVLYLSSLA